MLEYYRLKQYSDLDIALSDDPICLIGDWSLEDALDEAPLPFKCEVVILPRLDAAFRSRIEPDFVELKFEYANVNVENAKPLLSQTGFPPTFEKVNGLLYPEMLHYDMTSGLKQLRMPVLIVQGRQDPLDLEEAGRTRDAIPGAKLVILERCGHFAWLEKADQLRNALLEFLQ